MFVLFLCRISSYYSNNQYCNLPFISSVVFLPPGYFFEFCATRGILRQEGNFEPRGENCPSIFARRTHTHCVSYVLFACGLLFDNECVCALFRTLGAQWPPTLCMTITHGCCPKWPSMSPTKSFECNIIKV